jgi:DNA-binding GntR family transcriptional regulator
LELNKTLVKAIESGDPDKISSAMEIHAETAFGLLFFETADPRAKSGLLQNLIDHFG